MSGTPDSPDAGRARRLLLLRGSIKLLVTIGFVFLLVPFFKSIPWPKSELPAEATRVPVAGFPAGATRPVRLHDGSTVLVTRNAPALAQGLRAFPADLLWWPSAPGLADQDWFVVPDHSVLDEPVRHLPARGDWPGGFMADTGVAWDLAGRALKPWPGHPGGSGMKAQNLMTLPWRVVDGELVLLPLPAGIATP